MHTLVFGVLRHTELKLNFSFGLILIRHHAFNHFFEHFVAFFYANYKNPSIYLKQIFNGTFMAC